MARTAPEALAEYLERCRALIPQFALEGRRIGVWQHSSVLGEGLVELLADLGAEVAPLGPSAEFHPVDTEAVDPEDARQLSTWARELGLEAIVSTDADADRPLMTDERGSVLRGDAIGILTARFLAADAVVTP